MRRLISAPLRDGEGRRHASESPPCSLIIRHELQPQRVWRRPRGHVHQAHAWEPTCILGFSLCTALESRFSGGRRSEMNCTQGLGRKKVTGAGGASGGHGVSASSSQPGSPLLISVSSLPLKTGEGLSAPPNGLMHFPDLFSLGLNIDTRPVEKVPRPV